MDQLGSSVSSEEKKKEGMLGMQFKAAAKHWKEGLKRAKGRGQSVAVVGMFAESSSREEVKQRR